MPSARPSTFLERAYSGWLFGSLVTAAYALSDNEDDLLGAVVAYGAGNAAGVMVWTARREGARPWQTILGAAIGSAPGVFATAPAGEDALAVGSVLVVLWLVGTPLAAAAGHGGSP
jgi:hypothetical protein